MKGSEARPSRPQAPKTTIGMNGVIDLTLAEKQDLTLFSGTPAYAAIQKLLELMLIEARDAAALIPPHKRDERLAALDTAYAVSKVMLELKEKISYLVGEHLGLLKQKQATEDMQDQAMLEDIIMSPINQGR
jgi:hypothetical protein